MGGKLITITCRRCKKKKKVCPNVVAKHKDGMCCECRRRVKRGEVNKGHDHGFPDSLLQTPDLDARIQAMQERVSLHLEVDGVSRSEKEMTPAQERAYRASLPPNSYGEKGGRKDREGSPRIGRVRGIPS